METEQFITSIGITIVLFFATLLLTSHKYKSRPNRFLAASLITLALVMLRMHASLATSFFVEILDFLRIEYLFSVFLYLYVHAVLKASISRFKLSVVCAPFILLSSLYIVSELSAGIFEQLLETLEPIEAFLIIGFNTIVVTAAIVKVYQSAAATNLKRWLYIISSSLISVMLFFLMLECAELLFDMNLWDSFSVVMTLFFVGTSYIGIQQLHLQQEQEAIQEMYAGTTQRTHSTKSTAMLNHYEHMQILMHEDELFRDASLDREIFAKKVGVSASSVTRILKEEGQMSFKEFINQYRIQLAKEMLTDTRFDVFSLEAIGKEVGFKSRSTFYETFKKEVGISPGVFKKKSVSPTTS